MLKEKKLETMVEIMYYQRVRGIINRRKSLKKSNRSFYCTEVYN